MSQRRIMGVLLFVWCLLLSSCHQAPLIIDVRSQSEYETGHIQQAILIPHDSIQAQINSIEPHKDKPIMLYCRSGRRAEQAKAILEQMGYTRVTNAGGYEDMKKLGYK